MSFPARFTPGRAHGVGLALIGYRGTGKSTVGRLLAERLDRPFVDSDQQIEQTAGCSIKTIFATEGEHAFRDLEERVLGEVTAEQPYAVLATGGGVILREANRQMLREFGLVVWLRAPSNVLAARLSADSRAIDDRPALTSAGTLTEISQVLEARIPLYRSCADVEIETEGLSPIQVAEFIEKLTHDQANR